MKVIQLVPTVSRGDAIGNEVFAIDSMLKKRGIKTVIYGNIIAENVKDKVNELKIWQQPDQDDVIVFHMSIYSGLKDLIEQCHCHKIVRFHNITPSCFFAPYNSRLQTLTEDGLTEIMSMKDSFEYAIADSSFNKQNLLSYGYSCPIDVVPIIMTMNDYARDPDPGIIQQFSDRKGHLLLFVGRIAPNKKIEDVIAAYATFKKYYDPDAMLVLAGSYECSDLYYRSLRVFINANNIHNVIFTGHTDFSSILAYYRSADLYLCMSEHEGFCVPLVESMYFRVPVLAFCSTAVPETLGNAGILTDTKDELVNAGLINAILTDTELAARIRKNEEEKLTEYMPEKVSKQFVDLICKYLE